MILRKIFFDNSRKYVPKSLQTQERDNKPKMIKNNSLLANKVKVFHKTTKKSLNRKI